MLVLAVKDTGRRGEGCMRREGSQSKSKSCSANLPFLSFPSFPSILFKNQPSKFSAHFFLIFALAKDCNNDETEKHDGDGTTHEEDGRRQRHDMRRRPQVRELVALRREGGRRGGKSLFSPFLFALLSALRIAHIPLILSTYVPPPRRACMHIPLIASFLHTSSFPPPRI